VTPIQLIALSERADAYARARRPLATGDNYLARIAETSEAFDALVAEVEAFESAAELRLATMSRLFCEGEAAGKKCAVAELAAILARAETIDDARTEMHLYAFRVLVPTTRGSVA
jgi:hypothetical protein